MADPEILQRSQRRAARSRRQSRYRRVSGFVAIGVLVLGAAGAALTAAGVIDLGGSKTTDRADSKRPRVGAPSSTTSTRPPSSTRRALTPDDPLRLWIAGDSLAGSIGPSLGELTAKTGVVQPQYDSRVSSGLLNPGFFDWPKQAGQELQDLNPEVVVFLMGTNDANVWSASRAKDYRLRTELMMHLLVGDDQREVFWVGPPVAKDRDLEAGVLAVAKIQQETAQTIPGVTYVDAHRLFADKRGKYQYEFAGLDGIVNVMRANDGVHFSVDGADYLGQVIFNLLNPEWRLTDQAVVGAAKTVRETKGATQVDGTHRSITTDTGGNGNHGGNSGSTTTTQPGNTGTTSTSGPSTTTTTTSTTTTTATTTPVPPAT